LLCSQVDCPVDDVCQSLLGRLSEFSLYLTLFLKSVLRQNLFFLKEKLTLLLFSKREMGVSRGPQYYTRWSRWGVRSVTAGTVFVSSTPATVSRSPTVVQGGGQSGVLGVLLGGRLSASIRDRSVGSACVARRSILASNSSISSGSSGSSGGEW
jgi:hypothetical protein